MQESLPLSSWQCCACCNGVAVVDAQASLQCRHLCCCCNNVVVLVAMVLLMLSSWCHCPCHDGIITIVNAQASPPLLQRHCCPCCAGAVANIAQALSPLLRKRCCPYCTDLFALMLHGHCQCRCTGIVAPIKLACLRCCAKVVALVMLALLHLVHWH
jgi:hypothetical protein